MRLSPNVLHLGIALQLMAVSIKPHGALLTIAFTGMST
jgi:hypothetical protein